MINKTKIAIIGLGYVGLPLALEFSKFFEVVAYDNNKKRLNNLQNGFDESLNVINLNKKINKNIFFTDNEENLKKSNFFIVTVPTPINHYNQPDLSALEDATKMVGKYLKKNDIVVYESTVYPGATEEICVPILEKYSRLTFINEK